MKRRLVAFMLIMAVCANLYTTVFAARDSAWSEEETDNMWETPDYMQSNGSASSGENSGTKEEEKPKEPIDGIIEINGGTITVMPDEEVKKEPPWSWNSRTTVAALSLKITAPSMQGRSQQRQTRQKRWGILLVPKRQAVP